MTPDLLSAIFAKIDEEIAAWLREIVMPSVPAVRE
jgi:hypothetical protein